MHGYSDRRQIRIDRRRDRNRNASDRNSKAHRQEVESTRQTKQFHPTAAQIAPTGIENVTTGVLTGFRNDLTGVATGIQKCADRRNNSSAPSINKYRVGGRGHKPRNRLRFAGRFLRLCPCPHLLRLHPRPERQLSRLRLERHNPGHRLRRRNSTAGATGTQTYYPSSARKSFVLPADSVLLSSRQISRQNGNSRRACSSSRV